MGNMLMNQRVDDAIHHHKEEHRIFPDHMYKGPLKLGDPAYRGLSKMEEDPMIPQRIRDEARTTLCNDYKLKFAKCSKEAGLSLAWKCRGARDELVACLSGWLENEELRRGITEEYLNERSHYRQTGHKTQRYTNSKYIERSPDEFPVFDEQGVYRQRKPAMWDESYPDGKYPEWATYDYNARKSTKTS